MRLASRSAVSQFGRPLVRYYIDWTGHCILVGLAMDSAWRPYKSSH